MSALEPAPTPTGLDFTKRSYTMTSGRGEELVLGRHLPPRLAPVPAEPQAVIDTQARPTPAAERQPAASDHRPARRPGNALSVLLVVAGQAALGATVAAGTDPRLAALTAGLFTVCGALLITAQRLTSE